MEVLISAFIDLKVSVRMITDLGLPHSVIQCAAESKLGHRGHLEMSMRSIESVIVMSFTLLPLCQCLSYMMRFRIARVVRLVFSSQSVAASGMLYRCHLGGRSRLSQTPKKSTK